MCECVCECARARLYICVYVCVCVGGGGQWVGVCVRLSIGKVVYISQERDVRISHGKDVS